MKDMNEMLRAGVDLRKLGDEAKPYLPARVNGKTGGDEFTLICAAEVEPEHIDWIWPGYLARGKLTLLGGDPELGKSMLCADIAARLSKGAHAPLGARLHVGASIFICSEDGLKDTTIPRLEAAGADLGLIHIFESTLMRGGKRKTFNLQDDLDMLGAAIDKVGNVSAVFIDALTSYMGKIDSHRTTDVRSVLEPIGGFAERHRVGITGVTHPPKAAQGNALRAFTGSFAFVAAPRIAFFVTNEPETDRRLLLPVKNNIGPKALGRGYFITTKIVSKGIVAPCIQWDDAPVDYTADQAIAANNQNSKDGGSLREAIEFLSDLLANGQVDAKEGKEAADANGISARTLDRARQCLKVKSTRTGGIGSKGGWTWALPA